MDDEKTARLGVTECVKHEILEPFKIMWEREGEFVAQFKILCLVLPNGNLRGTTTSTFDINTIKSEKNLEGVEGGAELISLLKTTVSSKSKKKKKKAKKTEEDAAPKEDALYHGPQPTQPKVVTACSGTSHTGSYSYHDDD